MSSKRGEHRIFERYPYKTKVTFDDEFGEGFFYLYSKDISLGGLFLASNIPIRVGTLTFLSFVLPPHKRPLRITGEVVRVSEEGKSKQGMGIRFVGLPNIAVERMKVFLSKQRGRKSG